jgi:hypothetical protein
MYMCTCVHVCIISAVAALLPLAPWANINSSAALLLSRIQPASSQNRPASQQKLRRFVSLCYVTAAVKASFTL